MSDNRAKINKIIDEHQIIRGHVKLVGESITDQEALLSLQSARTEWIPGRLEILSEKQNKLQKMINSLDEGLANHFAIEEGVLPPILGGFLMRALILEHQNIRRVLDNAKSMIANTKLEGLNREELMSREAEVQQTVNSLCHLIEEHANKEDLMLEMVQEALDEKG